MSFMKTLFAVIFLVSSAVYSNCGDQKLEISDIQGFFKPGELKSEYFTTLELKKRVRRCNSFSGCEQWSQSKATLSFGEIVSSLESEETFHFFPTRGDVYFKVTIHGDLQLFIHFHHLDISGKFRFNLPNSSISLQANDYFRPSGAHIHPTSYASYHGESRKFPFSLQGQIGQNCIELTSRFIQNENGILYDEYEIHMNGTF